MKIKIILMLAFIILILSGCTQKGIVRVQELTPDGRIVNATFIIEEEAYVQTMEIESQDDAIAGVVPLVSNRHFIITE